MSRKPVRHVRDADQPDIGKGMAGRQQRRAADGEGAKPGALRSGGRRARHAPAPSQAGARPQALRGWWRASFERFSLGDGAVNPGLADPVASRRRPRYRRYGAWSRRSRRRRATAPRAGRPAPRRRCAPRCRASWCGFRDRHRRRRFSGCSSIAAIRAARSAGSTIAAQQSVAERVLIEDVGEARRRDAADAEALQRPHRGLARAAAAEILAGQKDLRAPERRAVEDEVALVAGLVEAPAAEQAARQVGRSRSAGRPTG